MVSPKRKKYPKNKGIKKVINYYEINKFTLKDP
jgi:hypothetical protein